MLVFSWEKCSRLPCKINHLFTWFLTAPRIADNNLYLIHFIAPSRGLAPQAFRS